MTVGIGLAAASSEFANADKTLLIHSDEGWVDVTIIGICTFGSVATHTINCKLGQFDTNPDCLLLCDSFQVEIIE